MKVRWVGGFLLILLQLHCSVWKAIEKKILPLARIDPLLSPKAQRAGLLFRATCFLPDAVAAQITWAKLLQIDAGG